MSDADYCYHGAVFFDTFLMIGNFCRQKSGRFFIFRQQHNAANVAIQARDGHKRKAFFCMICKQSDHGILIIGRIFRKHARAFMDHENIAVFIKNGNIR